MQCLLLSFQFHLLLLLRNCRQTFHFAHLSSTLHTYLPSLLLLRIYMCGGRDPIVSSSCRFSLINSPFNRHSVALPLIRRFVFHIPMHPRLHLRLLLLLGSQYHIHFIDGSVYLHRRSGHINGQARNLSVTPHSVQLLSTGPAVSTPLTQFACSQPTRLTSSVGRRETSPPIFSGPGCLVA